MSDSKRAWPYTHDGAFATTQWTMISDAARDGDAESERALAKLCECYWSPVYAFIRRGGHAPEEAKDLTQGFFVKLLEKRYFERADRAKGKFRTYLLGAVKFFLADERDKVHAKKRGGDHVPFTIDPATMEGSFADAMIHSETPEVLFDRQWVRVLLTETEAALRKEYERQEKGEIFEMLRPYLMDEAQESYAALAARHGLSEGSLKTAASRLRKRFGKLFKDNVAATVEDPTMIDDEVTLLLAAIH